MARKGKPQESCVFEYDHIEQWGPELKRLFADVLPKKLKHIFEAEPPDDMEHAREILLAHMKIDRSEVVARTRRWIEGKRVAGYYGAWMTDEEFAAGAKTMTGQASLSRAPFERYFDAYVPRWAVAERAGRKPRIIRIEIEGAKMGDGADGRHSLVLAIIDAWAYWLADPEFSPADGALHIGLDLAPEGEHRE